MGNDGEQFEFPGALPLHADSGETEADRSKWVALSTTSTPEARELCAKLEANGLPCELAKARDDGSECTVFVRQDDLSVARDVSRRPTEKEEAERMEDEQIKADALVMRWICPKCLKPTLEFLPPTARLHRFRIVCVCLLFAQIIVWIFQWLMPIHSGKSLDDGSMPWSFYPWFGILLALFLSMMLPARRKFCPKCGWGTGTSVGGK